MVGLQWRSPSLLSASSLSPSLPSLWPCCLDSVNLCRSERSSSTRSSVSEDALAERTAPSTHCSAEFRKRMAQCPTRHWRAMLRRNSMYCRMPQPSQRPRRRRRTIETAIARLRHSTRQAELPTVFRENRNFGYERNLLPFIHWPLGQSRLGCAGY